MATGVLMGMALDGVLRRQGSRAVASYRRADGWVVLVCWDAAEGSYSAAWGPVVPTVVSGRADERWDQRGSVGDEFVGECPTVADLLAAAGVAGVALGLTDVPGLVDALIVAAAE